MGLAALALIVAVALGVFTLTRGNDAQTRVARESEGAGAIVAAARPATVLVRSRGVAGTSLGSGVVVDAAERLVLAAPCDDLALLEVESLKGFETLPLGAQDDIAQATRWWRWATRRAPPAAAR